MRARALRLCLQGSGRASQVIGSADIIHLCAVLIFVISLMLTYGFSMLGHSFFLLERTSKVFRMLDHSTIYVLIAGELWPNKPKDMTTTHAAVRAPILQAHTHHLQQ